MSTLLLVDADRLSLRVLDVSLRKAGYDVRTAGGLEDALALARDRAPDLLVTDVQLREGDGFALARTLREQAERGGGDLPVLFLSSADSALEREQARDLGAEGIVRKPVFVRELLARVQLLLACRVRQSAAGGLQSGTTRELALVDLLQSLETARTTGVVHLERDGHSAAIYLREGNVVDAELGRLRGADVVVVALGWDEASFRVEPGPVDNVDLFECTTHALLMRAMDRLDGLTPEASTVAVDERADTPTDASPIESASEPEPVPEPAAAAEAPVLDTAPAATARERSVPSTAPWTREAAPSEAPPAEADLQAAGVPGARSRTARRVSLLAAAAAAVLLVGIGMRSIHSRQLQEAERARAQLPTISGGVTGAAAAMAAPGAALAMATPIPGAPATDDTSATSAATESPAATDAVAGASPDGLPGVAAAGTASSAPAVDPRETALDVKTAMHARSALVRDAQQALLKGDTGKAKVLAQQAALTSPYDAEGWLTLAAARKASGDLAGARDAYAQCVAKAHTFGVMSCRALASRSE
jgi:DNA-binding response OmpR family regulator